MADVLIRTDASSQIGMGHAMRCLALAEELAQRGHRPIFISKDLPGIILRELKTLQLSHVLLDSGLTLNQELERLPGILSSLVSPVVAITDGYAFDETYQAWLKSRVDLLICLDDLAVNRFDCHAVLNQNLGFGEKDYQTLTAAGTTLFIGPKFSLLRASYRAAAGSHMVRLEPQRILISMGGGDRFDMTYKALCELAPLEGVEIDIILGPAYAHDDPIRRLRPKAYARMHLHTEVLDLTRFILQADVVICPSGSTVWQIACLGAPLITFPLIDNQAGIAMGLYAERAAVVIDPDWREGDLRRITSDLLNHVEWRQNLSGRSKQIVDGHGVVRITDWIESRMLQRG
ncbi:MAG: UDP-2,4-diacetamido-2,4,6-trideoxy-beta-L-altropyranose hydrolase [Acidobacteria bacterium]|nr:MAG: UDP-2,4-diacetamido-2,4,6-trideoxy-beta-L-altropyranose hydrolase [Acidobacteriota bacterium]